MINGQKSAPLPYLSVLIYPLLEPTIVSASKRDLLYKISRRILNYSLRRYIGADTTGVQEISFISNFNENITYPTTPGLTQNVLLELLTPVSNNFATTRFLLDKWLQN